MEIIEIWESPKKSDEEIRKIEEAREFDKFARQLRSSRKRKRYGSDQEHDAFGSVMPEWGNNM